MLSSNQFQPESSAVQSYLGILQGIITRMANNSSNCKTWCITVVSAILVVIVDKKQPSYVLIALIPVLLFFFLDTYYLALERGFRDVYNDFVQKLHNNAVTTQDLFEVKPLRDFSLYKTILKAAFSPAIAPFYGILTLTAVLAHSLIVKS